MNKVILYENNEFKISCGEDIFKMIKEIKINFNQENFIVFYLNNQNRIIKEEVIFKGGIDSCLICPNILFRNALLNNSNKIIIAHNHPSGDLTPSYEDKEVFDTLKKAGEIINIKVLDNIIFNKKDFFCLE